MEKGSLQQLLAQGLSLEEIGRRFQKHPSTVSYWMSKYGLRAVDRQKHAARGGIELERMKELVEARLSIAQIANEVGLSKTTVRYWLRRYQLRTLPSDRIATVSAARDAGRATLLLECAIHGKTEFVIEGRGYYRCKRCRVRGVTRRRRKVKEILIAEAGGACIICGYRRHGGALHFHHVDPSQKRLTISANGVALSVAALREEAAKCVPLCSNCHAEVEAGVVELPIQLARPPDVTLDTRSSIHHNPG